MSGRKRAAGTPKEQELELLKALKFVSVAQYAPNDIKAQAPYQQHCQFIGGYVTAFNGVIGAGYPIVDEMDACPNTHLFVKALEKVRGAYSLTVLNNDQLVINAKPFRALVPCVAGYTIQAIEADPPSFEMTDAVKDAAKAAGLFTSDGGQTVLESAIITRDYSFCGTNGRAMVEAFHGVHMPAGLLIPMSFFDIVAKVPMTITRYGFTPDRSLTIYFENGAWLRTQLYLEPVPNIGKYLDDINMQRLTELPANFWEACDAVVPHSLDKGVFFDNNRVMSHETDAAGAQHDLDVPFRKLLSYTMLSKFRNYCTTADFVSYEDRVVLGSDKVRGIVMARKWN